MTRDNSKETVMGKAFERAFVSSGKGLEDIVESPAGGGSGDLNESAESVATKIAEEVERITESETKKSLAKDSSKSDPEKDYRVAEIGLSDSIKSGDIELVKDGGVTRRIAKTEKGQEVLDRYKATLNPLVKSVDIGLEKDVDGGTQIGDNSIISRQLEPKGGNMAPEGGGPTRSEVEGGGQPEVDESLLPDVEDFPAEVIDGLSHESSPEDSNIDSGQDKAPEENSVVAEGVVVESPLTAPPLASPESPTETPSVVDSLVGGRNINLNPEGKPHIAHKTLLLELGELVQSSPENEDIQKHIAELEKMATGETPENPLVIDEVLEFLDEYEVALKETKKDRKVVEVSDEELKSRVEDARFKIEEVLKKENQIGDRTEEASPNVVEILAEVQEFLGGRGEMSAASFEEARLKLAEARRTLQDRLDRKYGETERPIQGTIDYETREIIRVMDDVDGILDYLYGSLPTEDGLDSDRVSEWREDLVRWQERMEAIEGSEDMDNPEVGSEDEEEVEKVEKETGEEESEFRATTTSGQELERDEEGRLIVSHEMILEELLGEGEKIYITGTRAERVAINLNEAEIWAQEAIDRVFAIEWISGNNGFTRFTSRVVNGSINLGRAWFSREGRTALLTRMGVRGVINFVTRELS